MAAISGCRADGTRQHRGRARWGLTALALTLPLFGMSCRSCRDADLPQLVTSVQSQEHVLFGRVYLLDLFDDAQAPSGSPSLQITGDDIVVLFDSTTGPYTFSVTNQTITYGGHTLEVTATPNEYRVDGAFVTLPVPATYAFLDGRLEATLR